MMIKEVTSTPGRGGDIQLASWFVCTGADECEDDAVVLYVTDDDPEEGWHGHAACADTEHQATARADAEKAAL
jgi:hypothetical protein